jgi:TolB-like protein
LLIQVAETLFPVFGFSEAAFRIATIVLVVGFVPVVGIAWVFEWTPQGLKLDSAVAEDADSRQDTGRWLDRAILVVLALAVGYFAMDKFVFDPARDATREQRVAEQARSEAITGYYGNRSIAVLPFVNMSSDPEQEFFAEGISEEVLNLLAKIRQLRVISRSSAFTFKGKDIEIPEIAERLNVGHILEGSVRKSGDSVRVTAQLIEARTDTHLWSETYDRGIEDIFAIQDEIARDVARNLELRLLQPSYRARVTDPEVYSLTLQAKHLGETRPPNLGADMYALLSKALEIDPDYVPALEWMNTAVFFQEEEGSITKDESYALYDQIKERILRLDPDNPLILATEGWDAFQIDADYDKAAEYYDRMLAGSLSNSNAIRLAATFATRIGRFEAAIHLAELSAAIDPFCFQCLYWVSRTNLYAGNYERALEARERYLRLGSGGTFHHGLTKLLQGDPTAALAIYLAMEPAGHPTQLAGLAMAHHDLGDFDQANESFRLLRESADSAYGRVYIASEAASWMGDNDTAFELIKQIVDYDSKDAHGLVFNPVYKRLHSDPRWTEFRESIGMTEERLAAIQFDPELPE